MQDFNIVQKSLPEVPVFATTQTVSELSEIGPLLAEAAMAGQGALRRDLRGDLIVLARNIADTDRLELDIGYTCRRLLNDHKTIGGLEFSPRMLPAVDRAATLVRRGTNPETHLAFGAVGRWIEDNHYAIAGPSREIFLEPFQDPAGLADALVEIQFPVMAV